MRHPTRSPANPRKTHSRRLLDWLRDAHGVDLAAVGMEVRCSRRHGVGVFATRRAHPGCTLARIPVRASLHAGSARASEFGKRVVAALRGAPISPQEPRCAQSQARLSPTERNDIRQASDVAS